MTKNLIYPALIALLALLSAPAMAILTPVGLSCGGMPLSCSGAGGAGQRDASNALLFHYWFQFENMQHIEAPDESTFEVILTFDIGDLDDWVVGNLALTEMAAAPIAGLSQTDMEEDAALYITQWASVGDENFIHEIHFALFCDNPETSVCNANSVAPNLSLYEVTSTSPGIDLIQGVWTMDPPTAPEPGTLALLGLGLVGLSAGRRRRA